MKAIRMRQEGVVSGYIKSKGMKPSSEDINSIVEEFSFLVDTEITAIFFSNYLDNIDIIKNRRKPNKWIFTNIDNVGDRVVMTLDYIIESYGIEVRL